MTSHTLQLGTFLLIAVFTQQAFAVNPIPAWKDSYSVADQCYCDTTYDHEIGEVIVDTPAGERTVRQVCEAIGPGPGWDGNPTYNDIQCGNGPPNTESDEVDCPGRVDLGPDGCSVIGPTWNLELYFQADESGTDAGTDAGTTDAGTDAGTTDAGTDAGTTDAGTDAGTTDAGTDAGTTDAGTDAGTTDAGTDAGTTDAGTDAGTTDAGTDAGTTDAGTDAGTTDAGTDAGTTDAGTDAGTTDAGTDAGTTDAGTDAGTTDAGTDAGTPEPEPITPTGGSDIQPIGLNIAATQFSSKDDRWVLIDRQDPENFLTADSDGRHTNLALNGQYLELLPDLKVTSEQSSTLFSIWPTPGDGPQVHYDVNFIQAGTYAVYVRIFSTGEFDDTIHVGSDGIWPDTGANISSCGVRDKWIWSACTHTDSPTITIPVSGIHSVQFSGGHDGFEFDQFVLQLLNADGRPAIQPVDQLQVIDGGTPITTDPGNPTDASDPDLGASVLVGAGSIGVMSKLISYLGLLIVGLCFFRYRYYKQ